MAEKNDPGSGQWHLDKRVNIAMIFGLLAHAAFFGMWVGGIDSDVVDHDRRLTSLEATEDRRSVEMKTIEGRLSSLEANSRAQLQTLQRIERILEQR